MTEGKINHPNISNIEVHGWNIIHRTTLYMHRDKMYNHVFNLIEDFVTTTFNLDKDCLAELLIFQKNYVINLDTIAEFPYVKKFNYDFLGYILDDTALDKVVEYKFDFLESKNISLDRFLENIYFGRKRNFGKALITSC